MEDLMELVAASLIRHGIECPAADPAPRNRITELSQPISLPDHNFRKKLEGEPAR